MKKEVKLLFVSLGIVSSLVVSVGELALRIRYGDTALPKELEPGYPAHLFLPDEKTGYTLTPGFRGKQLVSAHPDVELKINRQGLRDDERELPPSRVPIIVVGDSFTFGHGVDFEEIWPTLLEKKIREKAPHYDVIKGGVPGFGWRQYYQQYERLAQDFFRHSLVIVGFTVDAGERVAIGFEVKGGILVKRFYPNLAVLDGLVYEKASRHEWVNRVDAFLRNRSYFFRWLNRRLTFVFHRAKRALREWRSASVNPAVISEREKSDSVSPPPLSQQKHIQEAIAVLDSIWELAKMKQAKLLVLFIRHPGAWPEEVDFYQKALSERGVPTLDLSLYQEESPSSWLLKDGHWNEHGHERVAEIVYQFIRENKLLELESVN